jgi:hypothetical protein
VTQPSHNDVPALLDRWVAAGIITPDQAERLRADHATLTPVRPVSLVAEGLGYLGGVIVLVGLGLVLRLSWESLTTTGRVLVAAGIAAAFVLAGAFIPTARLGPTGLRLRGVLWAAATVAVLPTLLLAGENWLTSTEDSDQIALVAAAGTAVVAAALWAFNRHVLQHLGTVASVTITAFFGAMVAAESWAPNADSWFYSGLAAWGVGVVWSVLALLNVVPPRGGGVLGALAATIGGLLIITDGPGPLIALGTAVALVVAAVARRELALLAVSSVSTLVVLPFAVDRYLPGGTLSTALVLVLAGLALVATGVHTSRRHDHAPA